MEPIQLSIPTPCHESWDNMTPKDQGRFCASCAKVVVDFSAMSDAQLIQYFENLKTANVCGRVYPDQLNRTLKPVKVMQPRKKIAWYWQVAAAFSLFFFKGQAVKAQGAVKSTSDTTKKIKEINDIPIMLGGIRKDLPPTVAKLPAKLTQIFITDENKRPVPYASVQLLPEGSWLAADSTGKINLGVNHKVEQMKISAVGFEEKTIDLSELESNNIVINLMSAMLGEVVVHSEVELRGRVVVSGGINVMKTESIKQDEQIKQIADKSSKDGFSIFPNPATKGQYISMNIQVKKPMQFALLVLNASGKNMLKQDITVVSNAQAIKFIVPATWASGQYYISIRSFKEETVQTIPLLVL